MLGGLLKKDLNLGGPSWWRPWAVWPQLLLLGMIQRRTRSSTLLGPVTRVGEFNQRKTDEQEKLGTQHRDAYLMWVF